MKRLLTFDQLNELSNSNQVKYIVNLIWNDIKKEIKDDNELNYNTTHYSLTYISFKCEKYKIPNIKKILKKYSK
jgi:hypothetical protein